jgi:outer membrane lipoprotein-sorting protein
MFRFDPFLLRLVAGLSYINFQPPNKFRREVKGNSPSMTVSDSRELWIYYPNFKSAERYPLGKGSPLDATVAAINFPLNLENIETILIGVPFFYR